MAANAIVVASTRGPERVEDASGFFSHHGVWAPGIRLFRNLQFPAKALVICLFFAVPTAVLLGWQLKGQANETLEARMNASRQHVEIAASIVARLHAQERAGALTRAQAQQLARDYIAALRYDGEEYFWVNDMHARMVLHPIKPELDGKDMSDVKDPNGLALFIAFTDKVRSDGKGVVKYQWPKPGSDRPVDKVSYVQGFEPWGWMIGTGIYIDDLHRDLYAKLAKTGIAMTTGAVVMAYLFFCFYRVMDGGLKETRRHLHAMTEGDLTTSPVP